MSYDYEKAHNEDIAEIVRLELLCQEYRENGDRLMRVADEYKAEIERLNAECDRISNHATELRKVHADRCERKSAALRVALNALEYHTIQTRPIHSTDVAIAALREALK